MHHNLPKRPGKHLYTLMYSIGHVVCLRGQIFTAPPLKFYFWQIKMFATELNTMVKPTQNERFSLAFAQHPGNWIPTVGDEQGVSKVFTN